MGEGSGRLSALFRGVGEDRGARITSPGCNLPERLPRLSVLWRDCRCLLERDFRPRGRVRRLSQERWSGYALGFLLPFPFLGTPEFLACRGGGIFGLAGGAFSPIFRLNR